MSRLEFLPATARGADGRIVTVPAPEGEPDPYEVPMDLYCPGYEVARGLFGPPKIVQAWITILNTRTYRRDPEVEAAARERLVDAIRSKEGPEVVDWAGGRDELKARIEVDTFWKEWNGVEPPWNLAKAKRAGARNP